MDRTNALSLFPRLGTAPNAVTISAPARVKVAIQRQALRWMVKAVNAT